MHQRFQFSLRALLLMVTIAAVLAWFAKLVGSGTIAALLVAFAAVCGIYRKPLEGVLVAAFLVIIACWLGIFVLEIAVGDY